MMGQLMKPKKTEITGTTYICNIIMLVYLTFFFCLIVIIIYLHKKEQRKIKIEPRIKLNYNMCNFFVVVVAENK